MFAASLGDCQLVKLLLKYNASVNTFACPHDWNPLCAAIQANNKDIVRVLLDASRQKDSRRLLNFIGSATVLDCCHTTSLFPHMSEAGADISLIKKRHPALAEIYDSWQPSQVMILNTSQVRNPFDKRYPNICLKANLGRCYWLDKRL